MPSMPDPSAAAQQVLAWWDHRPLAAIAAELDDLDEGHALLVAADALADAADSDDEALRGAGITALFAGLVEPLGDSFTPAGRAIYARLFARIAWRIAGRTPALAAQLTAFGIASEQALWARHARARHAAPGPLPANVRRVVVLSRVTIGADVLLSSLVLQRLHQRFPQAELVLLGDAKLQGLFGGLAKARVQPIAYARRGPLRERLASWLTVVAAVRDLGADLVVAPDSRLDQLGLLPVTADAERYLLWENTQPEGAAPESLAVLLDRWLVRRLGLGDVAPAMPLVTFDAATAAVRARLAAAFGPGPLCAIKLDHGGNPAKALPRAAEVQLVQRAQALGWRVLLDRGFGPAELANSDALVGALGTVAVDIDDSGQGLGLAVATLPAGALAHASLIRFHGSIAGWAAALAGCGLALSYDSVGHHLAGALGIPVLVAFTGFVDPAFPVAWQPRGRAGVVVVRIATADKTGPESWQGLLAAFPQPGQPLSMQSFG
jgi:ADP-heptose:LPS heptosyltransferase